MKSLIDMKSISILLLSLSINVAAQRVEFNDPDLTFSFVKPTLWTVKDGLTVFVSPENESTDQPTIFFSITYFENPSQAEANEDVFDSNEIEPSIPSDLKEFSPDKVGRRYITNETALWASYYHTQNGISLKAVSYVFMKLNQRFEIRVSAPKDVFEENERFFNSIIESLIIEG